MLHIINIRETLNNYCILINTSQIQQFVLRIEYIKANSNQPVITMTTYTYIIINFSIAQQMFIKPVWKQQIYALKIDSVQNSNQLFKLVRKLYSDLPSQFVLKIQSDNGPIVIEQDQDLCDVKKIIRNRQKVYIEEKCNEIYETKRQQIVKQEAMDEGQQNIQSQNDKECKQEQKNISGDIVQAVDLQVEEKMPEYIQDEALYICELCGERGYEGVFYRCSVCSDMDICPNCEDCWQHVHPLIKIRDPSYKTTKFFAVIESQLMKIEQSEKIQEHEMKIDQKEKGNEKEKEKEKEGEEAKKLHDGPARSWKQKLISFGKHYLHF